MIASSSARPASSSNLLTAVINGTEEFTCAPYPTVVRYARTRSTSRSTASLPKTRRANVVASSLSIVSASAPVSPPTQMPIPSTAARHEFLAVCAATSHVPASQLPQAVPLVHIACRITPSAAQIVLRLNPRLALASSTDANKRPSARRARCDRRPSAPGTAAAVTSAHSASVKLVGPGLTVTDEVVRRVGCITADPRRAVRRSVRRARHALLPCSVQAWRQARDRRGGCTGVWSRGCGGRQSWRSRATPSRRVPDR